MMGLLCGLSELADQAAAALQFDLVAIVQPACGTVEGDNGWNAHFACHNRGMREQAPMFDNHGSSGGKEHDPAGICATRDEDLPWPDLRAPGIGNDVHRATHNAGATASACAGFASRLHAIGLRRAK